MALCSALLGGSELVEGDQEQIITSKVRTLRYSKVDTINRLKKCCQRVAGSFFMRMNNACFI